MKVFKIDVVQKKVLAIDIEKGLQSIYNELQCRAVECIYPTSGIAIYVDEEGLFLDPPLGAFSFMGYGQVISGHGIVVGTDDSGDDITPPITLERLTSCVRFEDSYYLPEPGIAFIPLD